MFESFAQNGEDVVLWRTLGHLPKGQWIDVGANDPDTDSVTRVFSDAGWTGINIEPMELVFSNLRERRPNDINLRIAVEDVEGERVYFAVGEGRALSTNDPDAADQYRQSGMSVEEVIIPTRSLASIWDEFVEGEVHFLKIDVEGAEASVLGGADFARHRPWIIVVESVEAVNMEAAREFALSTRPIPASRHSEWEHYLLHNHYQFVLFDGLNRFYVAREHEATLGPRLEAPVNVLDRSIAPTARRMIAEVQDHLGQIDRDRILIADRLNDAISERDALRAEVYAIQKTISWRVTAPLRKVRALLQR
jgi:FkbM family methyltransferase